MQIIPIILSGGGGTRLWPMSTAHCPKQFLALNPSGQLAGDAPATLFQETLARVAHNVAATDAVQFAPAIIVANAAHADIVQAQAHAIDYSLSAIVLEPCARNTAPAIALAAFAIQAHGNTQQQPDADSLMLVMPSDHIITDPAAFRAAVARAAPLAADGWMVTFGIAPDRPETGYGYIARGAPLADGVYQVDRFIEKPPLDAAQAMLAAGGHDWNGGIFLFPAQTYLDAVRTHATAIFDQTALAMAQAAQDGIIILPDAAHFAACTSDSIDYAVMEKSAKVAVVPVAMGWSDVGSWDALYDLADKDAGENALGTSGLAISARGNLVRSDGPRVSILGVNDLIVIAAGDEILIIPRGQSQDVRQIVAARMAEQAEAQHGAEITKP